MLEPISERIQQLQEELRTALQARIKALELLLTELRGNQPEVSPVIRPTLLILAKELEELEDRLNFVGISNAKRGMVLANRLKAKGTETTNPRFFKLLFSQNFPLGLTECLLYFPPADWSVPIIVRYLQEEQPFEKVIVISLVPAQQLALRPYGEDTNTLWIVPNLKALTDLLLSPEPLSVFIEILTTQLKLAQISPYQTVGGIQKDCLFFGHTQILAKLL